MKKLLYLGLLSVCVLLGSCVEKNVSNVFEDGVLLPDFQLLSAVCVTPASFATL